MKTKDSSTAHAGQDTNKLVTVSEVTEQVGREILESRLEPGAWATALYECDGKRQDALAVYTRLRVRQLTKQRRVRLAKVSSFESRRLAICMGDQAVRESIAKTIQDMLGNSGRGRSNNFVKPQLSLIWMTVLFFGTAGTVASFGRLFSHLLPNSLAYPLTLLSLLAGVVAVWVAMVLRFYLPKRWIMLGWNTGLVVTCNVLCISSVLLGTKVIKSSVARGIDPLAAEQPTSQRPTNAQITNSNRSQPVRVSVKNPNGPKESYLATSSAQN